MASYLPPSQPCQTCGTTLQKTFTCIQCNNLAFCETCWPKWVLHTTGAVGWNGKPHERADPVVLHRLRQILEPTRTEAEHEAELREDEDTTWFGFGRDGSGHSVFHDYGRFAAIMGDSMTEDVGERYPQLASFIGETGAGKSTLIKLLIDRQDLTSPTGSKYYAPVTSSNHDRIATTGDVHLYADPATLFTSAPLLMVDCEGLNGGEAMPKQLRQKAQDQDQRLGRHSTQRLLAWADTPQTRKREFAVAQLYPRILYTFSDVVVFVLRNPRSFESTVLERLLKWGAASIDKSLNQPVLPHAVIVLNATDANIDEREWDIATATEMLMTDIHGAIEREPALNEYAQTWRRRGKSINSTKELLECYYASISVIRIPYKGSYMLMNEQARKLSELLKDRCNTSHLRKKQVRMLANTEKLQLYLQASYDHFTRDLDTPFDFVKEALRHSPVSRNFEGNTLNLALAIRDKAIDPALRYHAESIFRVMGPMIASYVMFDAVRQGIMGTADRILSDRYADPCDNALHRFSDLYWPCSFTNPAYPGKQGRCCNVRSGHNPKGHQNSQGKIIGNGDYESDLDATAFGPQWKLIIRTTLMQLQTTLFTLQQDFPSRTELQIAALLHRERLNELYSNILGVATNFISYSACLCCLRELPECALPCGHVLCLPCLQVYGTTTTPTTIEINRCPLHIRDIISDPPWVITTKPLHAGARVLCLDGGGVRGIVQLQTLRAMENILGPGLPIQLFFDLIVGSDTGGIIAMGLGVNKWTVTAALGKFKDICKEAFTAREMKSIPIFGAISSLYHGSLYKTQPFERALKRSFSESPFFGTATHRSTYTTSSKVVVTAATGIKKQTVVFANYNRPDAPELPYQFSRSDTPSKEIQSWEAARATIAISPFFKSFVKPETNTEYIDAGQRHSCPVLIAHHESKAIWSDIKDAPPDIVLSLGTGRNISDGTHDSAHTHKASSASIKSGSTNNRQSMMLENPAIIRQGRGGAGNYKRKDGAVAGNSYGTWTEGSDEKGYFVRNPQAPLLIQFNNPRAGALRQSDAKHRQCEKIWDKFKASKVTKESGDRQRYMRISPLLFSQVPKLDAVDKMDDLDRETDDALRRDPAAVREAVHRLIASTFFFERDPGPSQQTNTGYILTGYILCRFRQQSPEIKALGRFLLSQVARDFEPYFLLEGDDSRWPSHQIVLTQTLLGEMNLYGQFGLEQLKIHAVDENSVTQISLCLQTRTYSSGASTIPISGFPRRLLTATSGVGIRGLTGGSALGPTHKDSLSSIAETRRTSSAISPAQTYSTVDNRTSLATSPEPSDLNYQKERRESLLSPATSPGLPTPSPRLVSTRSFNEPWSQNFVDFLSTPPKESDEDLDLATGGDFKTLAELPADETQRAELPGH